MNERVEFGPQDIKQFCSRKKCAWLTDSVAEKEINRLARTVTAASRMTNTKHELCTFCPHCDVSLSVIAGPETGLILKQRTEGGSEDGF